MDYSIFLWHSYMEKLDSIKEDDAMAEAIDATSFHQLEARLQQLQFLALLFHDVHDGTRSRNCYGKRCCIWGSSKCNYLPVLTKVQ